MADKVDKITRIVLCNVASDDYNSPNGRLSACRAIWSDTGGSVRIQTFDRAENVTEDHIMYLNPGVWTPIGNIKKVYRYLVDETACESEVYDLTNTSVKGIKLGF